MKRSRKATTRRGKKFLESLEPQVHEGPKKLLAFRGPKTSEVVVRLLKDLAMMAKPNCSLFQRKNAIRPFDDATELESLCERQQCALFASVNHSKKRPHNLILGRTFNWQVLDMYEFAVDPAFRPLGSFGPLHGATVGSRAALVFRGEWDSQPRWTKLQGFLSDFFRGPNGSDDHVNLAGLTRCIQIVLRSPSEEATASVEIRHYAIRLRRAQATSAHQAAATAKAAAAVAGAGAAAAADVDSDSNDDDDEDADSEAGAPDASSAQQDQAASAAAPPSSREAEAAAALSSDSKVPRVELEEIGPRMTLRMRREWAAADDVQSQSMQKPRDATKKPRKNVSTDNLGNILGEVHLHKQHLDSHATKASITDRQIRRKEKKRLSKAEFEAANLDAADAAAAAAAPLDPTAGL